MVGTGTTRALGVSCPARKSKLAEKSRSFRARDTRLTPGPRVLIHTIPLTISRGGISGPRSGGLLKPRPWDARRH